MKLKKKKDIIRNCEKWRDIETVKFPEIISGRAMLERILSINVLKLLVTLVSCSKKEKINKIKVSL